MPSAYVTAPGARASCRASDAAAGSAPCVAVVVTHQRPPRCPTTTAGTASTLPGEPASKVKDPNATGPVPGRSTSSRTTAPDTVSAHHRCACAKRSPPRDSNRAASPHPTSPSPRRTQETHGSSGSRSSSGPGSSTATVRTTSGAAAPDAATVTSLSVGGTHPARPTQGGLACMIRGRRGSSGSPLGRDHARQTTHASPGAASVREDGAVTRAHLDKRPDEVAAMFDTVAARYDLTNDVLSLGQDRLWRRAVVRALDVRPGERVLDLAAGTGTSSEPLVAAGADVVPADFSLGMLRVGKRRSPRPAAHRRRRDATAVRRRLVRRGHDLVRPAQRRRHRGRPARDAARDPARWPAGDLRVQPPRVGAVSRASTSTTSCARCRRSPAR